MSTEIIIKMDAVEFEALSTTYMAFNKSWDKQIKAGRFEGITANPGFNWIMWFDNVLALILAKSYLTAIGEAFIELNDANADGYVIVTNFNIAEVGNVA